MVTASTTQIIRQLLPMTLVGVSASLILFGIVLHLERSGFEAWFRELAEQRIITIRTNGAIAMDSVNLVAGHFASAPAGSTSREGFKLMVGPTLSNHAFIQGLSWDPRVSHDQRPLFEQRARKDGLEGFLLTERDADGKPRPVADRDEYVPIYFMEPAASNARALGFDLASNPVRRAALEQSRDKGRPQATGRVTLVQEYGDQYGVLVLAPVYGMAGPRDEDSNRQNLTGYVSGVFRIGDLIMSSPAGGRIKNIQSMVNIHLFDMSAAEDDRLLYPKIGSNPMEALKAGLNVQEYFSIADRKWLLIITPSDALTSSVHPVASYAMLMVSLVATAFYLFYFRGRVVQSERAIAFARDVGQAKWRLDETQRIARLVSVELNPVQGLFDIGEGAAEMLGLPTDRKSGSVESILVGVHSDDREAVRQAFFHVGSVAVDLEFRIEGGGGRKVIHALASEPAEGRRSIITLQDITARKIAEEERTAMIERIAEFDRFEALGTLAGGIAHEINTPTQYVGDNIVFMKDSIANLLDVVGAAQNALPGQDGWERVSKMVAALDLDFLAVELPAAADQALDGTAQIAKIVQAIKEFSYPSSKSVHPIDLNHMIDVVATVTRNQWKYVAEMEYDLDPDMPKVSAVEGEINQVLVNLIVNAAQAIVEKGGENPGRITMRTRRSGDEVELSVIDTGSGISAVNLKQVFEMFFTTKAPGMGTGQGLAISRAIIQRHGGQLTVESEPGSGACFRIRLPLVPTQGV